MNSWLAILLVVVIILLSPVLIPVALLLQALSEQTKRGVARKFVCLKCGAVLGTESLRLADVAWNEYVSRLLREKPGMRLRLCRTLHAICSQCEQEYHYLEKDKTFVFQEREKQRDVSSGSEDVFL